MSSLSGVVQLNPRSVDDPALHTVAEKIVATDAVILCARTAATSVRMAHCPDSFDVCDSRDATPNTMGTFMLCWDGRLHNRRDLAARLSCDPESQLTSLVIAAYERWGANCCEYFCGDFAFALWDGVGRKLLLARDSAGVKPLHFCQTGSLVAWASDPHVLLRVPGVHGRLDEAYLSSFLCSFPDPGRSPFANISSVRPGERVEFEHHRVQRTRYWDLWRCHQPIKYSRDEEYEEHFRMLFCDAIRHRIDCHRSVVAGLSGGLDSSSIVCVADTLRARGETSATLTTLSYVSETSWQVDEREFIREVEAQRGTVGIHIRYEDIGLLEPPGECTFLSFPSPAICYGSLAPRIRDVMQSARADIHLNGTGGDQVLLSEVVSPLHFADMLRVGDWRNLTQQFPAWSRATRRPVPELLWTTGLRPLLNSSRATYDWSVAPWVRRTHKSLKDPYSGGADYRLLRSFPAQASHRAGIQKAIEGVSSGLASYAAGSGRVEVSFPFLDRALVEFLVSIPFTQIVRPGESRSIQRRSLSKVLPSRVLTRLDKRGPDEMLYRALARNHRTLRELTDASLAAELGLVDVYRLRQDIDTCAVHGVSANLAALLRFFALEWWLRALNSPSSQTARTPSLPARGEGSFHNEGR